MPSSARSVIPPTFLGTAALAALLSACAGKQAPPGDRQQEPGAAVAFQCDGGTGLTAAFYPGTPPAAAPAGQPPRPAGRVRLAFPDGRTATLARTLSANGARYAAVDSRDGRDSMVFWEKGNGALLQAPGSGLRRCIRTAPDPGGLPQVFVSAAGGFSIRYPADYTADTAYRYQALGPGKDIPGVAFTVPASLARGTNLSADTHLSVETMPPPGGCTALRFLGDGATDSAVEERGTTYDVGHLAGAGAGNRYEETVYVMPGTAPCVAVRYFLHWTVLENYPPGAVSAFDRAALVAQFDAMRATLVVAR